MPLSKDEMQQLIAMRPQLINLCRSVGSRDPENSAQQTFLRVLESQHHFQSGTNLRAWVFLIARNEVLKTFRKLNREILPGDYALNAMAEIKSGGQHEALELKEAFRFIAAMPPEKQEALFAALNGIDYKKLSEQNGVALGTTKSRVNRARAELAYAMDPDAPVLR